MSDKLQELVEENAGETIVNNPAIPNERNQEVMAEAKDSIAKSLQSSLAGGDQKEVLQMFSTGHADSNNPVVQKASGNFVEKLQQKFGLNVQQAFNIANGLIPNVMSSLAQKTADPANKSFNVQDIFNQVSGGKTAGLNIQETLNKFKNKLDKDGDGDVDLQDLKAAFSGEGSVVNKIKGMFK